MFCLDFALFTLLSEYTKNYYSENSHYVFVLTRYQNSIILLVSNGFLVIILLRSYVLTDFSWSSFHSGRFSNMVWIWITRFVPVNIKQFILHDELAALITRSLKNDFTEFWEFFFFLLEDKVTLFASRGFVWLNTLLYYI